MAHATVDCYSEWRPNETRVSSHTKTVWGRKRIVCRKGQWAPDSHVPSAAVVVAAALLSGAHHTGTPWSSGRQRTQRSQNSSVGTWTGGKHCSPGSFLLHTGGGQLGEKVSIPVSGLLNTSCCSPVQPTAWRKMY